MDQKQSEVRGKFFDHPADSQLAAQLDEAIGKKRTTINQPFTLSKYFYPASSHNANNKVAQFNCPSTQATSQVPSLYPSGPTVETDDVGTPAMSGQGPSSPSTLTHIPSIENKPNCQELDPQLASSSSQLPSSSPLLNKIKPKLEEGELIDCTIVKPKPTRNVSVGMLEALASNGYHSISPEEQEDEGIRRREFTMAQEAEILSDLSRAGAKQSELSIMIILLREFLLRWCQKPTLTRLSPVNPIDQTKLLGNALGIRSETDLRTPILTKWTTVS